MLKRVNLWATLIVAILTMMNIFISSAQAQTKKYQVPIPGVNLHLEPDEKSPVVANLAGGEVLAQASAIKFKRHWVFVYYRSPEKGKTLAGYVVEKALTKLFPEINEIVISDGESVPGNGDSTVDHDYETPEASTVLQKEALEQDMVWDSASSGNQVAFGARTAGYRYKSFFSH